MNSNSFKYYSYEFDEAKSLENILKEKTDTLQDLRREDVIRLLHYNGSVMKSLAGSEDVVEETSRQAHQHMSKWHLEKSSVKR